MSEQNEAIIQERLRAVRKLVKEGRYDAARYILEQLDHPKAGAMLEALAGRQEKAKPTGLPGLPIFLMVIVAGIFIAGLILTLRFIPPLINAPQTQIFEDFYNESMGNIILTDEEILYANLAMYCYDYTGYGGELCLDWTEFVLADYGDVLGNCLDPLIDVAIPTDENYATVGQCLRDAGIPPPL